MATQIVMDHSGDTRHHFDATDREAVAKAEERFLQLTGAGLRQPSALPRVTQR